jgi:hypothetical protein
VILRSDDSISAALRGDQNISFTGTVERSPEQFRRFCVPTSTFMPRQHKLAPMVDDRPEPSSPDHDEGDPVRTFDSLPPGPLSETEYRALEMVDEFEAAPLAVDFTDGSVYVVSISIGEDWYFIGWHSDDAEWEQIFHLNIQGEEWEIEALEVLNDETGELELCFEVDQTAVVNDITNHIRKYIDHRHGDGSDDLTFLPETVPDALE